MSAQPEKAMDYVIKVGKIIGMLVCVLLFLSSIKEKLDAIPGLQDRMTKVEGRQGSQAEMLMYLVGGMEQMTGKKFKPRPRQQGGQL